MFFVAIVLIAFFLRSASCCCVTNTNSAVSNNNVLNNNAVPTAEETPMIAEKKVPPTKRSTLTRIFQKNTEPLITSDDKTRTNQTKTNRFSRLFGYNNKTDSVTVVIPEDERPTRSGFFSAMSFWKKSSDNNQKPEKTQNKKVKSLAAMYEMKRYIIRIWNFSHYK